MWAGQQCTSSTTGVDGDSVTGCVRRWGGFPGKVCGVPESEAAGEELGVSLVERNKVNMGTDPGLSLPTRCQCGGGQGRAPTDGVGSGRSLRRGARSGEPATWRREAAGQQCWDWNARRSPVNTGAPWPTSEEASVRVLEHLNQAASPALLTIRVAVSVIFTNLVHDPATVGVAWDRVRRNRGARTGRCRRPDRPHPSRHDTP